MTEKDGGASLATAVVSSQILTVFEHHNAQIYVYASIQNSEKATNPRAWNFYYVPVLLPAVHEIKNNWIWTNNGEVQLKLMLTNPGVEEQARKAIARKFDREEVDKYSASWTVAPLMIDSMMAYIVRGSGSPVEGVHPYRAVHPNTSSIIFRFQCSTEEIAEYIMGKLEDGSYEIEISCFFAGFKQVSTNITAITGEQLKSVLSKTSVDGGNTSVLYIHRSQLSNFVNKYAINVKKMIYVENPHVSGLTQGLEEQFLSLLHQGMENSKEVQLSAGLFEQIWSSSDLSPNRITHELNRIFTYNEAETRLRNDSQKYFTVNRDALTSVNTESTGGGLHVNSWFNGMNRPLSLNSTISEKSINEIVSATEIERRINQQGIEIQWSGEKLIPKSFNVYKLLDITDQLQIAIISKQLIADRNNGAISRTVSILNTPMTTKPNYSVSPIISSQKINREEKKTDPRKPPAKCNNEYLEEYVSNCEMNCVCELSNKNISDDDLPYLIEHLIFNKQCQELSLNNNSITDKGVQLLAEALRRNPRLEQLNLSGNSLTDRAILALVNALISENKNLSILILENLKLGPAAGTHLARMLSINNTLTQLLLNSNQLKDRGMNGVVFALQNNISLIKLDMRNNDLTDRCFEATVQLLSLNRALTELLLTDNLFSNEIREQFSKTEEKYGVKLC